MGVNVVKDIIYDLEAYPNLFCITFMDAVTKDYLAFEISDRVDQWDKFLDFVDNCKNNFVRWVGFNSYYFDYQVIHRLLKHRPFKDLTGAEKAQLAFDVANKIIKMSKEEKFQHVVWDNEHIIPQVDLYRIHHFDNVARATSLKKLEFNMRSKMIQDLPYAVGSFLTHGQKDEVLKYNLHDVRETGKLYDKSLDMIRFREELTNKLGKNFLNHNDTKIGKDYFILELENSGISCFEYDDGEKKPRQTHRHSIDLNNIIFHYIEFKRPEFQAVLHWLKQQRIRETKAVFTGIDNLGGLAKYANLDKVKGKIKNLNCVINGFQFDFGTGGIHGSIAPNIIEESGEYAIIDYDVTSLYPSIAIQNKVYPKHLTDRFCEIYARMKEQRLSYPKGTPENAMLKLALNGVYGDSNNVYSPFYDPQYTMTITINGQLMLCMLAEMHLEIPDLKLIQINTDGVTIKVPRKHIDDVEALNKRWESITGLSLERADYSKMFIRDVNNYVGLYTDGKLKRKGKYEYEREWHQDQSALVIQKAVEAYLVKGENIEYFIKNHPDPFDFMLRTNVPRTSRLLLEHDDPGGLFEDIVEPLQNVTRYYISTDGGQLVKVMPPLKQTPSMGDLEARAKTPGEKKKFYALKRRREKLGLADKERLIHINDGCRATPLNIMGDIKNVDYNWYIREAHKLVGPLIRGAMADLMEIPIDNL